MKLYRLLSAAALSLCLVPAFAQVNEGGVEVDYDKPQKYIVGGVRLE